MRYTPLFPDSQNKNVLTIALETSNCAAETLFDIFILANNVFHLKPYKCSINLESQLL